MSVEILESAFVAGHETATFARAGVLRRLGDDSTDVPRNAHIAGDPEAWSQLRNR